MPTVAVRWTLAVGTIAASLAFVACGDDDSVSTGSSAAALVPADALVYADAVVRPEGDQREHVEAALGTLLGVDDPGATIVEALEGEFAAEDTELDYAEDLEPWLGERGGVFFLNFEDDSDGAFVLEATDDAAAQAALERIVEAEGEPRSATYEGVEYTRNDEGDAAGLVDGFAVIGSNAGFEAAVDTSAGESLADSDTYAQALETAADDRLVTVYAEPGNILDVVVGSGDLTDQDAA